MKHQAVLYKEYLAHTIVHSDSVHVDGTLGASGHALGLLEKLGTDNTLIGLDQDQRSIDYAREKMLGHYPCSIHILKENFRDIAHVMSSHDKRADSIFLDLGWNQDQFDDQTRGFSFKHDDAPLDMNLGGSEISAYDVVNTWNEETIADVLYYFSDERYARRISTNIVAARSKKPIESVGELVNIVEQSIPPSRRPHRIHPATKTFQAIRMAVNDEMGAITQFLDNVLAVMNPHRSSRIIIITFHSVEDRLVKNTFRKWEQEERGKRVEKKGITPTDMEIQDNPRSRSARMRIFETNETNT